MFGLNLESKFNYTLITLIASSALIIGLGHALPDRASLVLLGFAQKKWTFSIQVFMWILFVAGFLLTLARATQFQIADSYLNTGYLPTDDETILQTPDLHPIFTQVKQDRRAKNSYLADLIYMAIVQFRASKSVEQTTALVTSQLNMLYDDLDLKYAFIRYYVWLLPTIGFIGTVYGISLTVSQVGSMSVDDPALLTSVASSLAVAFDTTLVALIQTSVLLLMTTIVQRREESTMNKSGQYVLSNLVNRLYREW